MKGNEHAKSARGGRSFALDYAKGIGIVVVVFAHLWRGLQGAGLLEGVPQDVFISISALATMVSMPTFFFASGFLYGKGVDRRHGLKEFLGKVDAILYPFIVLTILIGLVECLTTGVRNGSSSLTSVAMSLVWPSGIFWFLAALMSAFGVCELLIAAAGVRTFRWLVLPVALLMLALWSPDPLPFALRDLQLSFIYFALGVLLSGRFSMVQSPSWPRALIFLTLMALVYGLMLQNEAFRTQSFRSVTPNALVSTLALLFLFYGFCLSLPTSGLKPLLTLGERSMDVYLTHLLFIGGGRILLHKVAGLDNAFVVGALSLLVGIWGPLVLADLLRRLGLGFLFSPPAALSIKGKVA
jgi:fucose 4-O-acetylase-like acetyltransferase